MEERPRTQKIISSLSSLLEARRLLRNIKNLTDVHKKELVRIEKYFATSKINRSSDKKRDEYCQLSHSIAQEARQNMKMGSHILTALNTHLRDDTNLSLKLKSQTGEILDENKENLVKAGNLLTNQTTKFESPLKVIASDINKRFKNIAETSIQLIQETDTYAVITVEAKNPTYIVLEEGDPGFYLKTYTEWPSEPSEVGRIAFSSPSQAFKTIVDILEKDGLLEV